MFMQIYQEISYLKVIFQNVHSRFLDALDHLQNHATSEDDSESRTRRTPITQGYSKRSILSRLGKIVMSIFGDGSPGGHSHATIKEIKTCIFLQQN